MSHALRRKIFVGCRELGLDDETRRALQLRVTGKESTSNMSDGDMEDVLGELRERGFKPSFTGGFKKRAGRADLRLVHVLWKFLGDAGELKNPTRAGLNAFIRSRFGRDWGYEVRDVDDLTETPDIAVLIRALKEWNLRVDTAYDPVHHR